MTSRKTRRDLAANHPEFNRKLRLAFTATRASQAEFLRWANGMLDGSGYALTPSSVSLHLTPQARGYTAAAALSYVTYFSVQHGYDMMAENFIA